MVVQSNAKPGRDDDYNAWYDGAHFKEICALPGIIGGRRFAATDANFGPAGQPYLAIYEVETEDPRLLLAEMGKRGAEGKMTQSDALDVESSVLWFYKQM
jgi:hypothetical protein